MINLNPTILAISAMGLAILLLSPRIHRAISAMICAFLLIRFQIWHFTVLPVATFWQILWGATFYFFEIFNSIASLCNYFFMSRHKSRTEQANKYFQDKVPSLTAPTDVFICTYNEPTSVLEPVVKAALALKHPDLRVFFCDDGSRDEIREFAHRMGAGYITRSPPKLHAKAGNINNGLKYIITHGRKPEFLLLLDADFIVKPNILERTLGFFTDPKIGIVQTPQFFYNRDPIQNNLKLSGIWFDEQRYFFSMYQPCLDAWGAAFCCGTSAVLRVEALVKAGGMATETLCEDMLTSFKLGDIGYKTIYLNEQLSVGLAAEDINAYQTQRSRWCLGTVQQLFTKYTFWSKTVYIDLINRLAYFTGANYWIMTFPFKVIMCAAPTIYLLTGAGVVNCTVGDMVNYYLSYIAASLVFTAVYCRNRVLPVITDIAAIIVAPIIIRTVLSTLISPFGRPFKVTPKGIDKDKITIQYTFMCPLLAAMSITVLSIFVNISSYSYLHGDLGFNINIMWAVYNASVFLLTAGVCVELPGYTPNPEKPEPIIDRVNPLALLWSLAKYPFL
jgi:cellulose synthase (UDP-forming)